MAALGRPVRFVAAARTRKSGASIVALELRLDAETLLKLRGSPAGNKPVAIQLVRLENEDPKADCQLAAMINGQRVALPKAEQKLLAGEATDGRTLSTLHSELSKELVNELAVAQKFAIKNCTSHWSVSDQDVAELRHFAQLYQEERAWQGPASEGGSGGLMAPPDGWPAWTVAEKPAAPVTGPTLEAPALFKLLSPSVFKVVVVSGDGTSQGSAVAVSTSELLTNCHVLEGAQTVTLRQGKLSRPARIARANPAADRCVLAVSDANLTAIRGIREYAQLQVGEPLYNLVGITTLVLAGRERLNQSLNFAIPAEAFGNHRAPVEGARIVGP